MMPSIFQGESRVPYTVIPITLGNDNVELSYDCDEFCGTPWRIASTIVGLGALLMFLLMIPMVTDYSFSPISHVTPPKFSINSLRVATFNISQGELSATWTVNLTISNGVNSTLVNFLDIKAIMVYKEDNALALNDPIEPNNLLATREVFVMDKNDTKTLDLSFNTTGWEGNQPIVDDDVIQEIGKKMELGVMSFGLKIEVEAEIQLNLMNVPVAMNSYCPNLEVDLTPLERGEVAILKDVGKARECLDTVNQWDLNDAGN